MTLTPRGARADHRRAIDLIGSEENSAADYTVNLAAAVALPLRLDKARAASVTFP